MDSAITFDTVREEAAARAKFESFKLGGGGTLPASSTVPPKHSHARSHSRGISVSSLSSSTSHPPRSSHGSDMSSSFSFPMALGQAAAVTPNPTPSTKRNSHHKRRSSVSTRHESAELMGVTVPELPPSTSEDNINLGEKDSIRRRALWALEGKPEMAFSKVEIPELGTPDLEKIAFEFSTKPSFPTTSNSGFGTGLNSHMSSKRDSFKLLAASSSSKDHLHTLVEEEEEEEEETQKKETSPATCESVVAPPEVVQPLQSRPRPAALNLRPLSLLADNPTVGAPSSTPSPNTRSGLRSLSLSASASVITSEQTASQPSPSVVNQSRRPALYLNLGATCDSPSSMTAPSQEQKPRRSSISYRTSYDQTVTTSLAGLPTPEMTPTSSMGRRHSTASTASLASQEEFFHASQQSFHFHTQNQSLSASEQHFLFKSHNALLTRITLLEKALSTRRRSESYSASSGESRPVSLLSETGSFTSSPEVDDEMLRLIADLKAERDELKRDVEGWRKRVSDLEKQIAVLSSRVEAERRDAWVFRSRVGLLEVEKTALEKRARGLDHLMSVYEQDKRTLIEDRSRLDEENSQVKAKVVQLESELERVKRELEEERQMRQEREERDRIAAEAARTPRALQDRRRPVGGLTRGRGLGFTSVDSESSATDVELESFDDNRRHFAFALKAVAEESEGLMNEDLSEEEDALAGYEDEGEEDMNFTGPLDSSSSFGSDDFPRSVENHQSDMLRSSPDSGTPTVVRSKSTTPEPSTPGYQHVPIPQESNPGDKMKSWSFAMAARTVTVEPSSPPMDRFFGCLEDLDDTTSSGTPPSPGMYEYERTKSLFAQGFAYGSEDDSPFFFRTSEAIADEPEPDFKTLDSVMEAEEEEEEEGDITTHPQDEDEESGPFGGASGITFMFTPPEDDVVPPQLDCAASPAETSVPVPTICVTAEEPIPQKKEEVVECEPQPPVAVPAPEEPATPVKGCFSSPSSVLITPPPSLPRSAPSSIPRSKSMMNKVIASSVEPTVASPNSPSAKFSSPSPFVTPPTKRGGVMPSFIPQSVSSPSPIRSAAPKRSSLASSASTGSVSTTFIRQPTRKSMIASPATTKGQSNITGSTGSIVKSQPSAMPHLTGDPSTKIFTTPQQVQEVMKSIDLSEPRYHPASTISLRIHEYPDFPLHQPFDSSFQPLFVHDLQDSQNGLQSLHHQQTADLQSFYSTTTPTSLLEAEASPTTTYLPTLSTAAVPFLTRFSKFLPSPWSPVASDSGSPVRHGDDVQTPVVSDADEHRNVPSPRLNTPRGYVPREQQLAKLRLRMQREGKIIQGTTMNVCRKCANQTVFL
ncbi:hypothetical protein BDN72DRAFT_875204 [Pluteus cervinus]|uniref:Uncharacterized protein n=1 Tax=Pluteus cervinus TaxID=181527 RepID=A0ACD3B9Q2_9AGAR|nr:hypothetical protein BDN72DRAFT_875204 [Pluteus cervinus]